MKPLAGRLIRGASLLVPGALRKDWLREWEAEFAHVRCILETRQLWRFALGSFQDALWNRRNHIEWDHPGHRHRDSPQFCLAVLLTVLAAVCVVSFGLPMTRAV